MACNSLYEGIEPFIITTPRLIVVPTPIAVSQKSYRSLYAALHADAGFCRMGFGPNFPVRQWDDEETREIIQTRDINRSWKRYAIGDFAVGLRAPDTSNDNLPQMSIFEGQDFETIAGPDLQKLSSIEWVGYTGIRDACTTSLPPREPEDPALPPWQEMVEIRYGVSPDFWGRGLAREATEAILKWSIQKRGVRRFIAETEGDNKRSGGLLQRIGFVRTETNYWKEPGEIEWELIVK